MTTTNEPRKIYGISNDFDTLDIEMKESILTELMKKFIGNKRKIPARLLGDLKEVKKQNKKGLGYDLHMDCKNTRTAIKVYYKQYKHLDKYYPHNLDNTTSVGSIQRGIRADDIEKKYERLIRTKCESHIWVYYDKTDKLCWVKPLLFKRVREQYSRLEKDNHIKKLDFKIGDVEWFAINLSDGAELLNYGLTALTNEMIYGFTAVFDDVRSRDDYYEWVRK